jgi:hypothetical protein
LLPNSHALTTELIFGAHKLLTFLPAMREVHRQFGQQDDLTTDPQYFVAANTQKGRRVAAVLVRRNSDLQGYVLFYEHRKWGIGLGLLRGGDAVGDGLVAGPEPFRLQYVQLATEALLRQRRIHGVNLAVMAPLEKCVETMGPANHNRIFSTNHIKRKLPLACSYTEMLAGMGPRTRRSLATKRRKLEAQPGITFLPQLEPDQALEVMLKLQPRSQPHRITGFYHARRQILSEHPDFFSMGMRLPNGAWLSILSGWRRNQITYVDLQMNDVYYKKESISAVMRAFLLEHEIERKQQLINFVGGTSLLLRRYCEPIEHSTYVTLWRPGLRTTLFKAILPRMKPESFYERTKAGSDDDSV